MLLKKLTAYDIFEESVVTFDFEEPKKSLRKKDIERMAVALSYAFFGDPGLAHGKTELFFEEQGSGFSVRDFKENTATLKLNDETLQTEDAINEFFHSKLGLNKSQWDKFFFTKEKELYENSFENTGNYFTDVLSSLSIDKEKTDLAALRFKSQLSDYDTQEKLLADIASSYDVAAIEEDLSTLSKEITELQTAYSETEKAIAVGEKTQVIVQEYDQAAEEYKEVLSHEDEIKDCVSKVETSRKISNHILSIRKAIAIVKENDELKPLISQKKADLAAKIKETEVGDRVLKKKQAAYSDLSTDIQAHYVALSEAISQNASSEHSDSNILNAVKERFSALEKQTESLKNDERELLAQLKDAEKDVTVYTKKYHDAYVVQSFDKLRTFNLSQIDTATQRLDVILSEKADPSAYLAQYRDLEKKREECFRGYILADNLLKEIEAIDSKIGENEAAIKSQQENLDALENAKETLTQYLEKCRKKVEAADANILALKTREQYFLELDALEYGENCPVCHMPVIDKADTTSAMEKIKAQLQKQNDDISSFRNVLTEYAEKLEEINLRIGSLRAKINTSKGYVASLQQSKLTKISMVEKIYADAGVHDKDELATLLDNMVIEIEKVSDIANELKGIHSSSSIAEENVSQISSYLSELAGASSPGSTLSRNRQKLSALEKDLHLPAGTLSGEGGEEGDAYSQLKEALDRKITLENKLADIRRDITDCQSRYASITENDKEMSYGQLCIAYVGKIYTSEIGIIREKEEKKQTLVNEIAALINVLKDKREAIERDAEEIRSLENRFQANLECLETITFDNASGDKKLQTSDISELEKEILSEGETSALQQKISEFEQKASFLGARCEALEKLLPTVTSSEEIASEKSKLSEIGDALTEKRALWEKLSGIIAMKKALEEKMGELHAEKNLYQENYSFLTHVFDDGAVIVKDTVNYALMNILPKYSAECKGAGLILKEGNKTLNTISDEVYSVLLVALTDAFRYIVSGILDCPSLLRVVTLKSSAVGDNVKEKIDAYAKAHHLVVLYVR